MNSRTSAPSSIIPRSLGYGDIVMPKQNRLPGPQQAINGVLMISVFTAVLMAVFQDAMKKIFHGRRQS